MQRNPSKICVHWFRRDLRLFDNHALYEALKSGDPVLCVFIFDKNILNRLSNRSDLRVNFIYRELHDLKSKLEQFGSSLLILYGEPETVWNDLLNTHPISAVYTNRDYEPYAKSRDLQIAGLLQKKGISFNTFKDQVIFEERDILKDDGTPYTVFTPYSKKWKSNFNILQLQPFASEQLTKNFAQTLVLSSPSLEDMGFNPVGFSFPSRNPDESLIRNYESNRDYPFRDGTSRLSMHLRFGTVSIRQVTRTALSLSAKWLDELIWREFYMYILYHFPHVETHAFKPAYDRIAWKNNPEHFARWCAGETGYPIVDAGMRELNQTGFMHNRVRMIVASFLTKHLLIDWRWGEAYFAEKLLDFELASNNGGWQWAAGSGVDAAPYFRIFNPYIQSARFDPENRYIKKWVPEWNTPRYPKPIVRHEEARALCLEIYKSSLGSTLP